MLALYIGNKNYSSWSMRPWVLMREAGIAFDERVVRFDGFDNTSEFKRVMAPLSPTGTVPLLVHGHTRVWDSLAIAEYVAEQFPDKHLWPQDPAARAVARSVCAEMHGGFTALRNACPMNIEASLPEVGQIIWRDQPKVRDNMARLEAMWSQLLSQHGGPMLFGHFSIADAYFAPVCSRLKTYQLPVSAKVQAYVDRVHQLPSVQAWVAAALAEHDFVPMDEPYRAKS